MKYPINAEGVPEAHGPYSQGTTAGRLIFTAGQLAVDPEDTNRVIQGDVAAQTDRILDIIELLLAETGCTLADVAQTTVYLANIDDMEKMNEVYARRFEMPAPSRSVVAVSALPLGALVEMDCIACR